MTAIESNATGRDAEMQSINLDNNNVPETEQPGAQQAMDPARPHAEESSELKLRGGEEGRGMCPGRFCFIIPCPIPCNFCIFPCPC